MNNIQKITTILLYALFFALVGTLAFFIVYNAAWIQGDQHQFMSSTAIGNFFSTKPIAENVNRFWPLGLLDVNLVLLFGTSATAHFAVNVLIFLIFTSVVLLLCYNSIPHCTKSSMWTHIIVILGATLIISRLYPLFVDIIYPEKMLCTMLAIFLLCGIKFFQTDKWLYGVISLLAAIYATYCKEPIFGALLVFGVVLLLWGYKTLSKQQKIYTYLLIANSLIFILIYYFYIYSNKQESYSIPNIYGTKFALIIAMLRSNKMLIVAIPLMLYRIYALVFKREKKHLFFDASLLAGWAYFFAMIILSGFTFYYYTPCIVLIIPAVLYFCLYYLKITGTICIIGVFSGFYLIKVPLVIKNNQELRKTIPIMMDKLANFAQNGTPIVFYDAKAGIYGAGHMDLEKTFYNTNLDLLLKNKFKFENRLISECDSNTIIMYSRTRISNANGDMSELDSLITTYSLKLLHENSKVYVLEKP